MITIKKTFDWSSVVPGDELVVINGDTTDCYMAIVHASGDWYDLMFLSKEECEYMPVGLSYSSYEDCILHLYPFDCEIEIKLIRKQDKEDAIEFAYDKGFKPRRRVTMEEIESLLGFKVDIIG